MNRPLQEGNRDRLRWIAVVPGAILGGLLTVLSLGWVLPQPEMPGRLVQPFAIAAVFVWSGSRIAPRHRALASVVLVGIWTLFLGGFIALLLNAQYWSFLLYLALIPVAVLFGPAVGDWDRIPSEETIVAMAGALAGLFVVMGQVTLQRLRARGTDVGSS